MLWFIIRDRINTSFSTDRGAYDVPIDFRAREWGMQEEADLDIGKVLLWCRELIVRDTAFEMADVVLGVDVVHGLGGTADEATEGHGEEHEVVVLHPDHAVLTKLGADGLCKLEVDLTVGEPVGLVKVHFTGMVVEEGPQDRV